MNCVNWGRIQIAFGYLTICFCLLARMHYLPAKIVIYGYLCENIYNPWYAVTCKPQTMAKERQRFANNNNDIVIISRQRNETTSVIPYKGKVQLVQTLCENVILLLGIAILYEIMSSWVFQWEWMHISKNNVYRKVISFLCHKCGNVYVLLLPLPLSFSCSLPSLVRSDLLFIFNLSFVFVRLNANWWMVEFA